MLAGALWCPGRRGCAGAVGRVAVPAANFANPRLRELELRTIY